jgi:hypothetical protein
VGSPAARTLEFYDVRTHEGLHTISGLTPQPHEISWDRNRRRAYITHTYRAGGYRTPNPKGHEISVVDVDRMEVADIISTTPYFAPHGIAVEHLPALSIPA